MGSITRREFLAAGAVAGVVAGAVGPTAAARAAWRPVRRATRRQAGPVVVASSNDPRTMIASAIARTADALDPLPRRRFRHPSRSA